MSRAISLCLLIVGAGAVVCVAAAAPRWIDDHNEFMKGFINHELLAILGVILVITLASAAQIHLKFNDLEEREKREFLSSSRREVRASANYLILSFVVAICLVFVKPLFVEHHFAIAFINGSALWLLFFNVLILFDLTAGIFAIPPDLRARPDLDPPAPGQPKPPSET